MPKIRREEADYREAEAYLQAARNTLLTAERKIGNMYPKQPGKEMRKLTKIREALDDYRWDLETEAEKERREEPSGLRG